MSYMITYADNIPDALAWFTRLYAMEQVGEGIHWRTFEETDLRTGLPRTKRVPVIDVRYKTTPRARSWRYGQLALLGINSVT